MTGSQHPSKAAFPCAAAGAARPLASSLTVLQDDMLACRICRDEAHGQPLAHEPRPIFRISRSARLIVASQAPGIRAHRSGVPFQDASGERLRSWMGLDEATFYDAERVAIVPMGFCFPGHDSNKGDMPPRRECRATWHDRVFATLPQVETILAIGLFAIRYHVARLMPEQGKIAGLNETVAAWRTYFERPGTTHPALAASVVAQLGLDQAPSLVRSRAASGAAQ